jgi:hypothetical protein
VVVEFIEDRMVILGNKKPWQVTTNFIIMGLDSYENAPCNRYKNACIKLDETNGQLSNVEAFDLLQTVSVSITRWSTIFDLKTREFQIVMGRKFNNPHHYSIE